MIWIKWSLDSGGRSPTPPPKFSCHCITFGGDFRFDSVQERKRSYPWSTHDNQSKQITATPKMRAMAAAA